MIDAAFRKEITVLAEDVTGGPLTDFPLLVSITDTDLKDNAKPDGFDIFFTESDGTTVIPYDREFYRSSKGELIAWVLVDLSDTVDNNFFMFYGNPVATDQQNPLSVWSTRLQDVFHFNQTSPLPWLNSSIGKNFTIQPNGPTEPVPVVGQIGTASNSSAENPLVNVVDFRMFATIDVFPTDFFVSAWIKYDFTSTPSDVYDSWASNAPSPVGESLIIIQADFNNVTLRIFDDFSGSSIIIGDMSDLAYHHVVIRYSSNTFDVFFDGSFVSSTPFTFVNAPLNFDATQCGGGNLVAPSVRSGEIDQLQVAYTAIFSNGFIQTSFDNQKTSGQGAGNFVKVGAQQQLNIISNNYLVLSQGSIDHESSSIINAVCGDSNLLIGDTVRLLPEGTGEGFTQLDDLLPRVGVVNQFGIGGYGIVVGGDFEGVYSEGVINIDSNNLSEGIIASFFGDVVRICTKGRCLALANGELTASINVGDRLTPSVTGLVNALGGEFVIATALQVAPSTKNIIAVDVQREGFGEETTAFKKQLTVLAADVTGASPLTDFPLLLSITDTDLRDNAKPNGFDIFFTESDGTTVIPYERESYDNTTGELIAWVLVDLSDTVDNNFFMFYGNPQATDQQNPTAVWSPRSITDVFHFNQSSFPWLNSTTGNDFDTGTTLSVALGGEIGTSALMNNNDIGTTIEFQMNPSSTPVSTTDFYVSFWVKFDTVSSDGGGVGFSQIFISAPAIANTSTIVIRDFSSSLGELFFIPFNGIFLAGVFPIGNFNDLLFHHVSIRFTSSSSLLDIFFDGSLVSSNSFSFVFPIDFDPVKCGGGVVFNVNDLSTERMDELQIAHNSSFSDGYVQTSFDNQKTSGQGAGNFVNVGSQQSAI